MVARMRRLTPRKAVLILIPVVIVAAAVAVWAVDARAVHGDKVPRNVTLAGASIGGYGEDDLDAHIAELAESYLETPGRDPVR